MRRLLDYIFSQYELSFLDDVMPEHVKRNTEDKQKRQKDGHTESATVSTSLENSAQQITAFDSVLQLFPERGM